MFLVPAVTMFRSLIFTFSASGIQISINCKRLSMEADESSLPLVSIVSTELIVVFNSMAALPFQPGLCLISLVAGLLLTAVDICTVVAEFSQEGQSPTVEGVDNLSFCGHAIIRLAFTPAYSCTEASPW